MLEGGIGAGTRIRFTLTVGGRTQEIEGRVDEPEPGRVLTETYPHKGAVTRFTVDPDGSQSRLPDRDLLEPSRGIAGLMDRLDRTAAFPQALHRRTGPHRAMGNRPLP